MPSVSKQRPRAEGPVTRPVTRPVKVSKTPPARSAWDLVDTVRMLLYGKSGVGKTTFWATFPKPILALICSGGNKPGELRSINTPEYRETIEPRIIQSTDQIKDLLSDADQYATVVLDHASGLQDLTLKEILGLVDLPAQKSWGLASQQDYGQSSMMCKEILRSLLNLSGNVVIVAQERTFGSDDDSSSEVLAPTVGAAMTPSVVGWLNPACDYVAQAFIRPKMRTVNSKIGGKVHSTKVRGTGVEYCLRTGPHDVYMTKFRVPKGTPLPELIVDPTYDKVSELIYSKG